MKVTLIPGFEDNYFHLVESGSSAMVVDPGSAKEVFAYLEKHNLKLEMIWVTHYHKDHIGGVKELQEKTGAQLYGPTSLAGKGLLCDKVCKDGDTVQFKSFKFTVTAVPGHTLDHLAYYCAEENVLFCGDTLFSLGCGRLFEGTFEQMFSTLAKLRVLPDETKVYCAHEYTLKNMEFSRHFLKVNGGEAKLQEDYARVESDLKAERAAGKPTVPSKLGFEKRYNLFLSAPTLAEFKKAREARNTF